jgi:alpha-ketoglutarate-dependent 2,4-dichlorophenoxyacetate dioxygenase
LTSLSRKSAIENTSLWGKKVGGRASGQGVAGWLSLAMHLSIRPYPSYLVPPEGGDTRFANLYLALEALLESTRKRMVGLMAVHSWEQSRRNSGSRSATDEEKLRAPPVTHPLVRTHPETGRQALYLGNHTSHIEGVPVAEGRELLAELLEHATQPIFVYRHRWQPGNLATWRSCDVG